MRKSSRSGFQFYFSPPSDKIYCSDSVLFPDDGTPKPQQSRSSPLQVYCRANICLLLLFSPPHSLLIGCRARFGLIILTRGPTCVDNRPGVRFTERLCTCVCFPACVCAAVCLIELPLQQRDPLLQSLLSVRVFTEQAGEAGLQGVQGGLQPLHLLLRVLFLQPAALGVLIQQTLFDEDIPPPLLQHRLCIGVFGHSLHQVVLGEAEEVGVAQAADVGCAAIPHFASFNVQNADLAEAAAGGEKSVLCDAVVCHHRQLPLFDDVHLLPYVPLPADVVPWAEDLRPQLEHQLHQQSRLAVLKNANFLQGLQVHVDGDLSTELVGQVLQHLLLVHSFLVGPKVIEPLDDTSFQLFVDFSEVHVVFDGVDPSLELGSRGIHVGNHGAHISHDCGEDQHPHEKIKDHEEVLFISDGGGHLSDGGEGEGRPVEAVDVTPSQGGIFWPGNVWEYPSVRPKPQRLGYGIIDAGVPVNDDQDVKHQVANSEDVGVVGAGLGAIEEFEHAGEAEEAVEPELRRVDAGGDVGQVSGQDGQQVQLELEGSDVAGPQLGVVLHQQPLFQKPWDTKAAVSG